jgi:hypothetical protein
MDTSNHSDAFTRKNAMQLSIFSMPEFCYVSNIASQTHVLQGSISPNFFAKQKDAAKNLPFDFTNKVNG